MRIPITTYRIQFNSEFRFEDAKQIVDYLARLGISDLYASPIFKATAGSTHGYDVTDPTQLNPELGTQEDFDALVEQLQQHQMGWLQDIVPNHMSYSSQNEWLIDVLENGPSSRYVDYFDIAWNAPFEASQEPILVPLLGNFYGACLENGEIQLQYDENGLSVSYYSLQIPLRLESYTTFLSHNLGSLGRTLGRRHPYFIRLLGILYLLKNLSSDIAEKQREDQAAFVKGMLWELYSDSEEIKEFIDTNVKTFNGEAGKAESFNLLDALLSDQFFRLSYWKVGAEEINYRRFFTVNELISVKVEELKVFNHTHDLIAKLVKEGKFTGLRVDHIDGLYSPTQYLERLQEKTGDTYITVEKILQPGEKLPPVWQMQGTSGYDYMNFVNSIFCKTDNEEQFNQIYSALTGNNIPFEDLAVQKKHLILDKNLAGDIDNLAFLMKKIAGKYRYGNDFTINGLKRALAEVLTQFSIYRTYTNADGVLETDRPYIEEVIQAAKDNASMLVNELNFIEKLMLLQYEDTLTQAEKDQWLYLVMRIQQYSGPLMAKGVEDTALYIYNRLLSLNEVGGNPERFGIPVSEFHDFNRERQECWAKAMSATATHDTKRGEDVRARLNVLSEMPEEWRQQVQRWTAMNRVHKTKLKNALMPDRNDEYALYQTLVGAFPFDEGEYASFADRVKDYMLKAIRESKVYTAWLRQNSAYEEACTNFVQAVLDAPEQNEFLREFLPFQKRVAYYGIFNSLSQTLIKITSPGIPDFYQGTELWDLSLVDPDNRRPVNFEQRLSFLTAIHEQAKADPLNLIEELLAHKEDGRIKLFLIVQTLKARREYLNVFQNGSYQPLETGGKFQDNIIAFSKQDGNTTILTVTPRFLTDVVHPNEYPLGEQAWADTHLKLPPQTASNWKNLITNQTVGADGVLSIGETLKHFPVALLVNQSDG
ncbi:malto-oligosyltrehalose synthase [Phormidium tenue FACHB-886]|nr:malto-oligosyltrehalose synthase [Phormidium tenue FACHB-886]